MEGRAARPAGVKGIFRATAGLEGRPLARKPLALFRATTSFMFYPATNKIGTALEMPEVTDRPITHTIYDN